MNSLLSPPRYQPSATSTHTGPTKLLRLRRVARRTAYTIGALLLDEHRLCDTLEGPEIDLDRSPKPPTGCAIPRGEYALRMDVVSPRFSNFARYPWAAPWGGRLPRLVGVPHFEGVLLHVGTRPADSAGCILIGQNRVRGGLTQSRATFATLMQRLRALTAQGFRLRLRVE